MRNVTFREINEQTPAARIPITDCATTEKVDRAVNAKTASVLERYFVPFVILDRPQNSQIPLMKENKVLQKFLTRWDCFLND